MERNIKKFAASVLALALLFSNVIVVDATEKMDLEELTKIFLTENLEIQKLNINEELLKLRYEKTLKDYEELKKKVDNARRYKEAMKLQKDQLSNEYFATERGSAEEQITHAYLNAVLHSLEAADKSYKDLIKQELGIIKNLELMVLDSKQASKKKQQEIEKYKYQLSNDYYKLLLLEEEKKLLQESIDLIDMEISLERTRKELDLSTDLAIFTLEAQRNGLLASLTKIDNTIELSVEIFKTNLGMDPEDELNLNLDFGDTVRLKSYNLRFILDSFMANSLDIQTLDVLTDIQYLILDKLEIVYDETDVEYKIGLLELEETRLNSLSIKRSYEALVKRIFYSHRQTGGDLVLQMEKKQVLDERQKKLEAEYSAGLLSKLQYKTQRLELNKAQLEYQRVALEYIKINNEMQLLQKGIIPPVGN